MKQIKITIHDSGPLHGSVDIRSDDFDFSCIDYRSPKPMIGLQCEFLEDTPEYKELLQMCESMLKAIQSYKFVEILTE